MPLLSGMTGQASTYLEGVYQIKYISMTEKQQRWTKPFYGVSHYRRVGWFRCSIEDWPTYVRAVVFWEILTPHGGVPRSLSPDFEKGFSKTEYEDAVASAKRWCDRIVKVMEES